MQKETKAALRELYLAIDRCIQTYWPALLLFAYIAFSFWAGCQPDDPPHFLLED